MFIILPEALQELKALPQWVAYRLGPRNTTTARVQNCTHAAAVKMAKIPLNPRTGKGAKADDASTWGSWEMAVSFADKHGYGVGFELAGGYAGIDLDDVVLPDGNLKPFAADIVTRMDCYTEYSPSGRGLHILFKLSMPLSELGHRRRNDTLGLEIYDGGRYLTVTGKPYGEAKPIAERTEALRAVYEQYMCKPENAKVAERIRTLPSPPTTVDTNNGSQRPSHELSDAELWERMFASELGRKIHALYRGDTSAYGGDWSRADLALCNYLSYWTDGDAYRMDALFRQSGLMRAKWDERHGGRTYGEMTIDEAIAGTPAYVPTEDRAVSTGVKGEGGKSSEPLASWVPPISGLQYVLSGSLHDELSQFQSLPTISTGFMNLDDAQDGGLVPGLYLLGGTPSVGKTSFCLQVCDNIAASGNFVLFFSLEQSRLELTCKSLARITAKRGIRNAVSSINIRKGNYVSDEQREAVQKAIAEYQEFGANIAIVELPFDATISNISDTVSRFIEHTGLHPVCVLDYIQLVQADDNKLSTRDNVEVVIRALKKLQTEHNLTLIAISSFNRQNYSASVDYSAFKESGILEYSADVVWGLQPTILADSLFLVDKKEREKRAMIDNALAAIPRRITLKNLKNRYGRRGYSCNFLYDCRFDWYYEDNTSAREEGVHGQSPVL